MSDTSKTPLRDLDAFDDLLDAEFSNDKSIRYQNAGMRKSENPEFSRIIKQAIEKKFNDPEYQNERKIVGEKNAKPLKGPNGYFSSVVSMIEYLTSLGMSNPGGRIWDQINKNTEAFYHVTKEEYELHEDDPKNTDLSWIIDSSIVRSKAKSKPMKTINGYFESRISFVSFLTENNVSSPGWRASNMIVNDPENFYYITKEEYDLHKDDPKNTDFSWAVDKRKKENKK